MDFTSFKESLSQKEPPEKLSIYLKALWYQANNNWEKAHKLIQDIEDKKASWIHAHLHRKEGDHTNAGYWYKMAGQKQSADSLEVEWEEIVRALI